MGPVRRDMWLSKATSAYREGTQLHLNGYYCVSNLPSLKPGRKYPGGAERTAATCAHTVAACKRARMPGLEDEWLKPMLLPNTFHARNLDNAVDLVDRIYQDDQTGWKLESRVDDLIRSVSTVPDDAMKSGLQSLVDRLLRLISVPQETLVSRILPLIRSEGRPYVKFRHVHARPAAAGERIVTVTSDGRETVNTAEQGDYVVRNATQVEEQYIVSKETFAERYEYAEKVDDTWSRYRPTGEVLALEIDDRVLAAIWKNSEFHIMAPWEEPQKVRRGDYFVSTVPDLAEVYRIARHEFEQTYQPKT